MPAGLKVLAPGLHTTVQDLGRIGWQMLGVPVSGALDALALGLGNALVGNPPELAALEILYSGPTLEVAADMARVAVAGIGAGLPIEGQGRGTLPAWQSVTLPRGAVFRIVPGPQSVCAYLAVEGGIAVPSVLGSASTLARAGLGGFNGRALRQGDVLPLAIARAPPRTEQRLPRPPPATSGEPIRVVLGPQQEYFTDNAMAALLGAEFRVSAAADRMGMRLDGPRLRHRHGWDIVSDAIATGAIQVPGSGQPVLLLADHQTTGGYPKIATVISADLPLVGRRRPGDVLRFEAVTIEEAEHLARDAERRLAALIASLEPVSGGARIDLASLYTGNLISGIVSARD
ncbi:MAG TPA: biotin-dependent carboxyltransferase family protein [Stellaceae bacterium]|jgi:allophanate hydrolase